MNLPLYIASIRRHDKYSTKESMMLHVIIYISFKLDVFYCFSFMYLIKIHSYMKSVLVLHQALYSKERNCASYLLSNANRLKLDRSTPYYFNNRSCFRIVAQYYRLILITSMNYLLFGNCDRPSVYL